MDFRMKLAKAIMKTGVPVLKTLKPDMFRRAKILKHHNIDLVFDVGANVGQYGELTRKFLEFKGSIVSFEPLNDAFAALSKLAANDANWKVNNFALGDVAGKSFINVAGNSLSSSILDMEKAHLDGSPDSKYIGRQEIEIRTLNDVFPDFYKAGNNVLLKIDAQGYEKNVIEGASQVLDKITLIQLEMSIVELYHGEMIYTEIIALMESKGFSLISLENGFSDNVTGQLYQVDGIFLNNNMC